VALFRKSCTQLRRHDIQLCDAPAKGPATVDGLIYAARESTLRLFAQHGYPASQDN